MKNFILLVLIFFSCQILNGQLTKPVFDVFDFGAKGDGKTNDRLAIQNAIDVCKIKGGTVLFRKGNFLTGQLKLYSNMTLYIDSSSVISGIQSDKEEDYPHHLIETIYPNRMLEDCQRRLIYGNHVQNVVITGGGTINGQGDLPAWMNVKELGTEKDRPSIFAFVGSTNIVISNLTLLKPACWTQVYIECNNITLSKLTINTSNLTPNRDGIDIVDCHNVTIEDCNIKAEDDGICFKSGSEYGCKDIVVKRCYIDKLNVRAGNCFKLGTDGLGSFTNFNVSELTLVNAFQNSAIAIESMDGALIDNLNITNCKISNCGQAFFIILADRRRTVPGRKPRIGSISNIEIKNITGNNFIQQYPSIITGIKGHHIQNIVFENISFQLKGGIKNNNQTVMEYDGKYPEGSKFGLTNASAFYIRHTDEVIFKNCTFTFDESDSREWLIKENVKNILVQ